MKPINEQISFLPPAEKVRRGPSIAGTWELARYQVGQAVEVRWTDGEKEFWKPGFKVVKRRAGQGLSSDIGVLELEPPLEVRSRLAIRPAMPDGQQQK